MWTVSQQNKDIAGFYILIRTGNNEIIVEHHVSYELRSDQITGNEICNKDCTNIELCILSKNSYGAINGWFQTQCTYLPQNFRNIVEKYRYRKDRYYILRPLRLQKQRHNKSNQEKQKGKGTANFEIISKTNLIITICVLILSI